METSKIKSSGRKTAGQSDDEEDLSEWHCLVAQLHVYDVIDLEYVSTLTLHEMVPIAWSVDIHHVNNVEAFIPAYLTRITKHIRE